MIRSPHPDVRGRGLPSIALFSVLALLAFGSFPVLAEANPNYEVEQTTLPGEGGGGGNPPAHHKNPGGSESSPDAERSTAPGGGGGEGDSSQTGMSKSHGGASQESNPSTPGGGSKPQSDSGKGAVGDRKPLASTVQLGEAQPSSADSSGSSPLVPILIAVAVLAAISVGAVLVRQRRGSADGISLKRG